MKKFVFSNASYLRIKNDEYDRLKRELENVDKEIEIVENEMESVTLRILDEMEAQEKDCEEGVTADKLMQYQNFFQYMREKLNELKKKKDQLLIKREGIQKNLFAVHNQVKVLEEMKEEQYAEYLKETAKEEAKDMDTVLSFNIHEGVG